MMTNPLFNLRNANLYLIISSLLIMIAWLTTTTTLPGIGTLGVMPYQLFAAGSATMLFYIIIFITQACEFTLTRFETKKWKWHKTEDIKLIETITPTILLTVIWYLAYEFTYLNTSQYVYTYANVPESFVDIQTAGILEIAFNLWIINAHLIVFATIALNILLIIANMFMTQKKKVI